MTNNLPEGFQLDITELPPGFTMNPLAMPPGFALDIHETTSGFKEYSAHLPEGFIPVPPSIENPNVYILNASSFQTDEPSVYVLDIDQGVSEAFSVAIPGAPGAAGLPGRDGADGQRGSVGPKGGQGIQGERGLQGEQGFTGLQGEQGEDAPPLEWEFCAIEEGGRRFEDAGMRFRNPDGTWSKCKRIVGRDGVDGRDAQPVNVANLAGAGAGGGAPSAPAGGGTTVIQVEGTVSGSGTTTIVTVPIATNEGLKWFLRAQNSVSGSAQSSEIMSHLSGSTVSFDKFSILGADMDFDINLTASEGNWIFDITNNVSDPLDIKLSRITAIQ